MGKKTSKIAPPSGKNAKALKQHNFKTLQAIKFKLEANASLELLSGLTCLQQNPLK